MCEEQDNREKIQKLRRLDSPTSPHTEALNQFPSPSYVSIDVSNKTSPKVDPRYRRSVSPKALFPPSIQKFLSGRCSASDAINKLKTPSSTKAHKDTIEKMRLLGALQKHDIEGNVISRKTSCTSPIVSPYYSISPQCFSPKTDVSPRGTNGSAIIEENIVMRIEDKMVTSPVGEPLEPILEQAKPINTNVESWKNNVMGYRNNSSTTNGSIFSQSTQGTRSDSYFNTNNNGSLQQIPERSQFASYFNVSTQGPTGSQTLPIEEINEHDDYEPRERTNSFLRDVGMPFNLHQFQFMNQQNAPDCKSMVENQLSQIQNLVQHKRTISPIDHKRTVSPVDNRDRALMQYFHKRHSNPNFMRDSTPQPLISNHARNEQYNHNFFQQLGHHGFGQFPHEGMMTEQKGFIYNQMEPNQNQQQESFMNLQNQSNMTTGVLTVNTSIDNYGSESNQELPNFNYIDAYSGAGSLGAGSELLEPDAFFNDRHESNDFDMNIIQSELNFVPKPEFPTVYDDPLNPNQTDLDLFPNNFTQRFVDNR